MCIGRRRVHHAGPKSMTLIAQHDEGGYNDVVSSRRHNTTGFFTLARFERLGRLVVLFPRVLFDHDQMQHLYETECQVPQLSFFFSPSS